MQSQRGSFSEKRSRRCEWQVSWSSSSEFAFSPGLAVARDSDMKYLPFARPNLDEQTIEAVGNVLRSGWITTGPRTAEFEAALSRYCGGRTVKTYTSATAALEVALKIAGIGAGDEVITTAMSFA